MYANDFAGTFFSRKPFMGEIPYVPILPAGLCVHRGGAILDYTVELGLEQDYQCPLCGRHMLASLPDLFTCQREHVVAQYAVNMGFDPRYIRNHFNEVALCAPCNTMVNNPKEIRDYLVSLTPPMFPEELLARHIDEPEVLIQSGAFRDFVQIRNTVFNLKAEVVARKLAERQTTFEFLKAGQLGEGSVSEARRWTTAQRSVGLCEYCGTRLTADLPLWLTADEEHVVPRWTSRIGYPAYLLESERNKVIACRICNTFAHCGAINRMVLAFETPGTEGEFIAILETIRSAKCTWVLQKRALYKEQFDRLVRRVAN